jgi:hypothetical protein
MMQIEFCMAFERLEMIATLRIPPFPTFSRPAEDDPGQQPPRQAMEPAWTRLSLNLSIEVQKPNFSEEL